jgi:nucleoside-diphosphate-sugar epimerase
VAIFYDAILHGHYTCFLRADTQMDMMYMPDALRAIVGLMEADPKRLRHRNAFNITAMQFTPAELAAEIRRRMPSFEIEYKVDPVRQAIADSWPRSMDDGAAREEWGWRPTFELAGMIDDMLEKLSLKLLAHRAIKPGGS